MNPKLRRRAAQYGDTFSRQDAIECGYTPSQIRERLRSGQWISLRRGLYAERVDRPGPPWERAAAEHRLAVHAAARALSGSAVVISHQSAVVLHGLPTWRLELGTVHVTRQDRGHGRILARTSHHVGRLHAGAITTTDGLPTTTIARSVAEVLGQMANWPGAGTALAALAFADGRSESVGESRLRVLMDNHGLPRPELQVEFTVNGYIARVDFYFPQYEVVVEFDGIIKYKTDAVDAVVREKRREDRLRSTGILVVRVTWDDLDHPDRTIHRLREAFAWTQRRVRSS